MERWGVTNIAAAPTAYRSLRSAGLDWSRVRRHLRAASCAGEPLNPDLQEWAVGHLGVPLHDHYGQSEVGMLVMNHQHPELDRPLRLKSMGHAMPGFRMVVLDFQGHELGPDREGELAIDIEASPLFWFTGYYRDQARTGERFGMDHRYYLTSDLGRTDTGGYFYSVGRSDDVINTAGYRVGPYEVESALQMHPAVSEAAVVRKPDELRGEIVKAHVVLHAGFQASEELERELAAFVKKRLGAHAYPREIEFCQRLPRTLSGKLQRYLLRES